MLILTIHWLKVDWVDFFSQLKTRGSVRRIELLVGSRLHLTISLSTERDGVTE